VTCEEAYDRDSKSKVCKRWKSVKGWWDLFVRRERMRSYRLWEKNNSMSPLQYSLLDEKKSGFDLLIATDGSIMYCDRKAIVVPPMRFYAMDLWDAIGSPKDKDTPGPTKF